MIKEAIKTALEGADLPFGTARAAMEQIMDGRATGPQIAAFLVALRMKGETIDEIAACAEVMRERCTRLAPDREVLEIVGTGGDGAHTFNISTVSAFVIAAAGVPVAKHGNRSASSRCGAADLIEALGARLDPTAGQSAQVLRQTGMCFMFAPAYHESMRHAAPVRREIGVRTLFNLLGPLANPAGASTQLLGVYDPELLQPMARVLARLGVRRAMVVHGEDGLDEITMCAPTQVCEVDHDRFQTYTLDPRHFGMTLCAPGDLVGGDARENAAIARGILSGKPGPQRDVVVLNSAASLYLAGLAGDIRAGLDLAREAIDSGRAMARLEQFVRATKEVAA